MRAKLKVFPALLVAAPASLASRSVAASRPPKQPMACARKQRLTCWGAVDRVAGQVSKLLSPGSPTPGFQDHQLEVRQWKVEKSLVNGYSCEGLKVACAVSKPRSTGAETVLLPRTVTIFSALFTAARIPIKYQFLTSFCCRRDWRRIMLPWISRRQQAVV